MAGRCGREEVAPSHLGRFLLKSPLMQVSATAYLSISWALASASQPIGCLKFTPMLQDWREIPGSKLSNRLASP